MIPRRLAAAATLALACAAPVPDGPAAYGPPEPPASVGPLLGEFEAAGDRRILLERDGVLRLRDTAGHEVMLQAAGPDTFVASAASEAAVASVAVRRQPDGSVAALALGGADWLPAAVAGAAGPRIAPRRPVDELRQAAGAAVPPANPPGLLPPDLVELRSLDTSIHYDIRYASSDNFMGAVFYDTAAAWLQRPAAEALLRAHRRLAAAGLGLLIHDAYRPWAVTWMFWEATPDSQRVFVADPASGSRHNRGAAVDVALYDRTTGLPVTMPSSYDEFSHRAYPDYPGGTSRARWLRGVLRLALEAEGFRVYPYEWWHFDYGGWERYPILNVPFRELGVRPR